MIVGDEDADPLHRVLKAFSSFRSFVNAYLSPMSPISGDTEGVKFVRQEPSENGSCRSNLRAVKVKLRRLSEAECYERCHGRGDPNVRVIARRELPSPRLPQLRGEVVRMTGEDLRRLFEERLDARAPGAS